MGFWAKYMEVLVGVSWNLKSSQAKNMDYFCLKNVFFKADELWVWEIIQVGIQDLFIW